MFGILFTALALKAEKGAQDRANYLVNKEHREVAKMNLWDGMERQVYNELQYDKYATVPDREHIVYWKGNVNKAHKMTLRTIQANKEYYNSGLTEKEFLEKYFLDQYKLYKARCSCPEGFFLKIQLYDNQENYRWISGRRTSEERNGTYCPAIVVTEGELAYGKPIVLIFLDEE